VLHFEPSLYRKYIWLWECVFPFILERVFHAWIIQTEVWREMEVIW